MSAEKYEPEPKLVFFKAYHQLSLLENALNCLKEKGSNGPQISILGKVDQFSHHKDVPTVEDFNAIKLFWKNAFHKTAPFGNLYNAEIGNIFFIGALTPIFLNKVDGKTLGMLSVGPYGILRGIGASENQSNECLKFLKNGSYVLIIRGYIDDLKSCEHLLDDRVNL